MTEWRNIPGWLSYQVSDDGRVRRSRGGPGTWPGRILKTSQGGAGYRYVTLSDGGCREPVSVHRLVCLAFHGQPPTERHVVAHRNGDPVDNRASNLRWATPKENQADADRHGTRLRGERQNGAKLTAEKVATIRRRAEAGVPQRALAREFGVSQQSISAVVTHTNWRHI